MDKLAVEQSIQGSTYRPADAQAAAQNADLNGFAFSFEELLQRVGARLSNAFSAADSSNGIMTHDADARADAAPRETASRKTADDSRDHRPTDDDRRAERAAPASENRSDDSGRGTAERSAGTDDRRAERPEGRDDAGQGAKDSENNGRTNQAASDDGNDAGDGNHAADGKQDGQAKSGNGEQNKNGNTAENAASGQAAAANQAAALYTAGVVGKVASQNAKSGNTGQGQQTEQVKDAQQGIVAQAAAGAAAKTKQPGRAGNHQNAQNNQNAGQQAAAKAGVVQQHNKPDAVQDQAQRLAGMIGKDTKAEVKVSVGSEQSQLTSKPGATLANTSVLTKDGAAANQGAETQRNAQAQTGQTNAQTQQMQLAANQQQAQAAQNAMAQKGPQSAGTGNAGTGTTTAGIQAGGGGQHGGGGDAANNAQNMNTGQQVQQNQQTREAQPQQQTHQAQRGNVPGSAVTEQISVKITKALQAGTDRINIQLKPAELGKVDVKLEMTHDGRVMTVVTAEKQDTLDMLRRDQSELQRALNEAGLQAGDMEFNLKGQDQQNAENDGTGDGKAAAAGDEADETGSKDDGVVMNAWESGIFMNGRIDMRA